MIDFANIKTTLSGRTCHYFGMRIGLDGSVLHCFGVWTEYGVFEQAYNDAGQQLKYQYGKWVVDSRYDPIAHAPKRKVWAYYAKNGHSWGIWLSDLGPEDHANYDACEEVEVP